MGPGLGQWNVAEKGFGRVTCIIFYLFFFCILARLGPLKAPRKLGNGNRRVKPADACVTR